MPLASEHTAGPIGAQKTLSDRPESLEKGADAVFSGPAVSAVQERWDVVVVGMHDPGGAQADAFASALAQISGMNPSAISSALQRGEVPVHAGMRRHEAELAASELDRLGAVVDLRLSAAASGAYPILKPDAERRSGTAVGGFIDDSATPPRMAGSGMHNLSLEPDPTGGPVGPSLTLEREPTVPAPPPVGPGTHPAAYAPVPQPGYVPPPGPPAQHGTMPSSSGSSDALSALSTGLDKLSDGDADALLGTIDGSEPAPSKPKDPARRKEFDRVANRPSAAQRQAARDARSGDPEPAPIEVKVKLERGKKAPAAPAVEDEPPAPPPKKKKKKRESFGPAGASAEAPLELDYRAAGLASRPVGGIRTNDDVKAGQSGAMMRADFGRPGSAVHSAPLEDKRPLLGPDRLSAGLFGGAAGLIVGLVVAVFMHKGAGAEAIVPLEEELAESLANPGGVVAGVVRPEDQITGDLEEAYGDAQRSFILAFVLIGAPLGLILGRLNRPG